MKVVKIVLIGALIASLGTSCKCGKSSGVCCSSSDSTLTYTLVPLQTDIDTVSYYIGYFFGKNLTSSNIRKPNMSAVVAGMNSALQNKEVGDMEQMNTTIYTYIQKMAEIIGAENLEKEQEFLAENAKKSGIETLEGGVQYKVLKKGKGAKPQATDKVKVHYVGTLIDGTEFDSSFKRKEPTTFGVNQVIKGWGTALQAMQVGSKWKLFIPSAEAYGPRGAGGVIGPNATLIFEVELLEIVKDEAKKDETAK
ncbi:peptidyl-prolyl cis-trans isomerase [Bacteroidia bacterium]|nr:peptidyl-prolyl cis-trans isomerase [Bacteroidia bacterium]